MAAPLDDSPHDDSPDIFSAFRFLIHGFDPHIHAQLSEAIELRGGLIVDEYDASCTHVVLSQQLPWGDWVCAAARGDGKILVTEFWVSDSLDVGAAVDTNYIVYKPVRDPNGIPGSNKLVVCLTGYQGQARRNIMRMVHLMGAHFCKPLVANKVTHLVCYKFEGEKFNLAKQLRIKLINHKWLEDCLKTWSILSEDDYLKSGLELELLEAEAKDSEDDERSRVEAKPLELLSGMVAEKQEFPCFNVQGVSHGHDSLKTPIGPHTEDIRVGLSDQVDVPAEDMQIDNKDNFHLHDEMQLVSKLNEDILSTVMDGQIDKTAGKATKHGKSSSSSSTPAETLTAKKYARKASNLKRNNGPVTACEQFEDASLLELKNPESSEPCRDKLLKDTGVQGTLCLHTNTGDESTCYIEVEKEDKDKLLVQPENVTTPPFLKNANAITDGARYLTPGKRGHLQNSTESRISNVKIRNENSHEDYAESASSREKNTNSKIATDVNTDMNCGQVLQDELLKNRDELPNASDSVTVCDENQSRSNKKRKSWQPSTLEGGDHESHLECTKNVSPMPLSKSNGHSDVDSGSTSNKDLQTDNNSAALMEEFNIIDTKKESPQKKRGKEISSSRPQKKRVDISADLEDLTSKGFDPILGTTPVTSSDGRQAHFLQTVTPKENSNPAIFSDFQNQPEDHSHEKSMALDLKLSEGIISSNNNKQMAVSRSCPKQGDNQKTIGCDKVLTERKDVAKSVKNGMSKKSQEQVKVEDNVNDQKSEKSVIKLQTKKGSSKVTAKSIKRATKKHVSALIDKENAIIDDGSLSKACIDASVKKDTSKSLVCYKQNVSDHKCFALSGRRQHTKPLQALIKKLGGKLCKDSHQWSYQTTHLVIAGQLRRTEKLFAAAAAGRWILREDYLKDSADAGVFLDEKGYEWYGSGMTEDGSISFEAPRKWREQRENSGCAALEGLRIILYGECIIPSLDTLKRAFKAGGADLLATSPPYTRFLLTGVDVAIVSPGTPRSDPWVQEFINHHIACVTTDFFVDLICKPTSSLDKHVLYDSHDAIKEVMIRLKANQTAVKKTCGAKGPDVEEICCSVCGLSDREDVMLLCGDDQGNGCGTAMHIDCCKPPLAEVPVNDWYCTQCTKPPTVKQNKGGRKKNRSDASQ